MAKKENNRKSGQARKHKERLREEAEARQSRYDSLSALQKLEQIKLRRGESAKESRRLLTEVA